MSENDTRWADQLLERARATAAPRAEDAARNLASIEAQLGIGPEVAPEIARRGSAGADATTAGRPDGREALGAARRGVVKGALVQGALVKGSLVLAFGVGTGIIGYLIGRAETERARDAIVHGAPAAAAAMPDALARKAVSGTTANAAKATDAPSTPESLVETTTLPSLLEASAEAVGRESCAALGARATNAPLSTRRAVGNRPACQASA